MRRFIFILMIALIPLRGWMGEAMATGMAAQSVFAERSANAINTIALQAINTMDKARFYNKNNQMMPDCAMHHASGESGMAGSASADNKTKHTCEHCQACHSTALVGELPRLATATVANSAPVAPATRYTSASVAFGQKPPIL